MGWLSGISSKRSAEFARTLVDKIYRQFPPASEPQLAKKGARRRLEGVIEHIMSDVEQFNKEIRPGWIGKARLGNALLWGLRERGYSKEFAEAITTGIVKLLASSK